MRRTREHKPSFDGWGIAGANAGANESLPKSAPTNARTLGIRTLEQPHLPQWAANVMLDVVPQRSKRRHVEGKRSRKQLVAIAPLGKIRKNRQKGRQRFARAGRRTDQNVTAFENGRNAFALRSARLTEAFRTPDGDGAVQPRERIYGCVGAIESSMSL